MTDEWASDLLGDTETIDPPDELDRIDVMASWVGPTMPGSSTRIFRGMPSWNPMPPPLPQGWSAFAHIRVPGTARTGWRAS